MDVLAFLVVAAVVIVTPGQDTALPIRNTLPGARRAGVATAAGVSAGQAVWTLATSVGLAAVVAASEPVFQAIKLAGAAYLVVLGLQSLRDALRKRARPERAVASAGTRLVWLSAYAEAVARAGDVLRRPAIRRVLDAVVGVVLVSLGLRLATERR
jgi:threonine/homoserine/homoserine lactone efflux protein